MKGILTESTKSNFKVLDHKPSNVLKRIKGVLSDFKSNRNGRIYPRELWENVLKSDYVKEMINSHGLVGELDHPEERLEISLQNVSHVINDMWIEGDEVVGIIDILPTPSGKIVSELLDYGTDIGISSRGAGSVGAGNIVDPDYQFVTFDFVARPSCEAARLNMIVEGVQVEIDNNSDDKVTAILEGYKTNLKEASNGLLVCDRCLKAIESREGNQGAKRVEGGTCNWCECDFDELYLISQDNTPQIVSMKVTNGGYKNNADTAYGELSDGTYYIYYPETDFLEIYDSNVVKEILDLWYHSYFEDNEVDDDRLQSIYDENYAPHKIKELDNGLLYGAISELYDRDSDNLREAEDMFAPKEVKPQPTSNRNKIFYETNLNYLGTVFEYLVGQNRIPDKVIQLVVETGRSLMGEKFKYDQELYHSLYQRIHEEVSVPKYQVVKTIEVGPSEYETAVHDTYDSEEQAEDVCAELRAQGIGARVKELTEAAMSDQDLYKTVLGWYKEKIEAGEMTLNQCYELLSDKAKVSLNKMVDQSKIKESLVNETINKLIKESIELNKRD